jgi:hypothetical protein
MNKVTQIRDFVLPYYATNDTAHQIDHADDVFALAMKMAPAAGYTDTRTIALAAYLHDCFSHNRVDHHTVGQAFALSSMTDDLFQDLSQEDRDMVGSAIAEHRASFKGQPSSILSELISSADRGGPNTVAIHISRAHTYGVEVLGMTEEAAPARAIVHIKEKYGRTGYARYPQLWREFFKDEMEAMYQEIESL